MFNGTGITDVCQPVAWVWVSVRTPASGETTGYGYQRTRQEGDGDGTRRHDERAQANPVK